MASQNRGCGHGNHWSSLSKTGRGLNRGLRNRSCALNVLRQRVRFGDQLEAARDEWFLPGTQQALFAIDSEAASACHC